MRILRGSSKIIVLLLHPFGLQSCADAGTPSETAMTDEGLVTSSSSTPSSGVSTATNATNTSLSSTITNATASTASPVTTSTSPASTNNPTNTSGSDTSRESAGTSADASTSNPSSSPSNTTSSQATPSENEDAGAEVSSSDDSSDAAPAVVCPSEPALTGGQEYCSNSKGNAGNGYGYELWAEGGGTGCMTVFGNGAAFKTHWDGVEDFLARVGLDFDETRSHQQVGTIWADFAETQTGSEEGLTYIGIYGWTVDPLREFYILDDWGATKPAGVASDGTPRDEVGTLVIDGETYDVWKKTRENKPSIKGTATFDQYFSIRRTARQCGRISVSEHFTGWQDLGLPLGNLYEVKLLVESQFNSGTVEFTSASVVAQ